MTFRTILQIGRKLMTMKKREHVTRMSDDAMDCDQYID